MPRLSSLARALLVALSVPAAPALAQDAAMPPRTVGVVTVQPQPVPRIITLPGRAVAQAQAAIRPRVSGLVTEILYRPGTALDRGAPLFRIDPTTYQANLRSAEAQVSSARAGLTQAETSFGRTERLLGSGTTQAQVDESRATLEQAQAALQSAEAALTLAQAELDWTTVTSPIDGLASVAAVSVGDLVTANQADAMATVTRLDPIEVDMYEPSAGLLAIRGDISEGRLTLNDTIQATLTLETGETYAATGELVAPGYSVSTSTGAVDTRFRFDNPRRLILPGMFLRGQIDLGTTQAFLVTQNAATRDKTGQLSAWVIRDGAAAQVALTDDGSYRNHWIVTDGLEPGDLLAVDNLAALTEGATVATVPVTLDENGVVQQAPAAAAPAPTE
ncbi:efflux RND transporter periplasmic adaptor subunit [Paracoccus sediminis]|uniref:Efflux RND transporter periplasmic adaptor subunit n=1 Tax=Paracoccus sediminis TaxID=1214787 RepID=A0A238VJT4_9RHOB|nr:efflux RND transporter periplasmic adaptor subunit [Paracoccus sediminis]TBN52217.1 efflux RND transporter periplasmic adaptor subunit [Paracoccus sediminis]SNR34660.1 membrane fusion protein, multidrug efflux system [Paracoccus sediminis]